jgi:hypothetical protein
VSTGLRSIATAGLLAILAFGLYAVGIGARPVTPAEAELTRHTGDAAALFFKADDDRWLMPLAVYAAALTDVVSPPDSAGRLAAAAIGGLNVALMFLLARHVLSSTAAGLGAALLLMATPAHIVFARMGVDAIYPLPFVLAWLIALQSFFQNRDRRFAAAGAFALGVGVYTTPSAPLTMGFLLVATLVAIWLSGARDGRSLAIPAVAFVVPLSIAAAWFAANPAAYPDTFGRWAIHAAHLRSPVDLLLAFVNWNTIGTRASLYWGFLDPSWLFFDGPADSHSVLHGAAPFLFATAVGLVAGIATRVRAGITPIGFLLIIGLAIAPLAASTFGERQAIANVLVMVPFVVILAAGGITGWIAGAGWWPRLGWGVIAALVIDAAWSLAV